MHRAWQLYGPALGIGLFLAGCRELPPVPQEPPAPVLAWGERPVLAPDVSLVSYTPHAEPLPTAALAGMQLSAEECAHFACAHSSAARLIGIAAREPTSSLSFGAVAATDDLRRRASIPLQRFARCETTGAALTLYYQLLEAELVATRLATLEQIVDDLIRTNEIIIESGGDEPDDFDALQKQHVKLIRERRKLDSSIVELNIELKTLIGLDGTPGRLIPTDQVQIVPEPLDAEQAVRVALAGRGDLQAVRVLIDGVDAKTVRAVRQVVGSLFPPLGALTAATRIIVPGLQTLLPALADPNVESLRRQLTAYLMDRERDIAKQIHAAILDWNTQRDLVGIAKHDLGTESARLRELTVRRDNGAEVEAAWQTSRIDTLQAEIELHRATLKWKRSDVKLRQLLGLYCLENSAFQAPCN